MSADQIEYDVKPVQSPHTERWAAEFPNPLVKDAWGEPVVVRRTLATTDKEEANRLVEQLKQLLRSEQFDEMTPTELREHYADAVVDAVVGGTDDQVDYEERRSEVLSLPWHNKGYERVMFVGTTGAGKTTLLRNLIGSNHHTDKFPSTSTGRTTTADIEIITGRDRYKGVVTFLSERLVRGQIEECVLEAGLEHLRGKSDGDVAGALLEHEDQTFRLKYILGDWEELEEEDELDLADDDPWSFDDATEDSATDTASIDGVDPEEREQFVETLHDYVERIRVLTDLVLEENDIPTDTDVSADESLSQEVEEEFQEAFREHDAYATLINDLLDEIAARFEWMEHSSALKRSETGWPTTWSYETDDRDEFLEKMRWFASNYAPRYGKLLTPVVQGMRVQGPFQSEFADDKRNFVFIDGQGLGHKTSEAGSVSSKITSRFGAVDVILVVDNAQQPMQKNPLEVVRTAAVSGHVSKLGIAFTHFDQVQGDNLPHTQARANHVLNALRQGINNLEDDGNVSPAIIGTLKETYKDRAFLFSGLHQAVTKMDEREITEDQVRRMFDWFEEVAEPTEVTKITPIFRLTSLLAAVRRANRQFQDYWQGLLDLNPDVGPDKEHWARIKALNRRVVEHRNGYEYDNLRPIADLIGFVMKALSLELEEPEDIEGYGISQAEKEEALDKVRRSVHRELHSLLKNRLVLERFEAWKTAYNYRGTGSTDKRARKIFGEAYKPAAPEYDQVDASKLPVVFDESFVEALEDAIEEAGGRVQPPRTAV